MRGKSGPESWRERGYWRSVVVVVFPTRGSDAFLGTPTGIFWRRNVLRPISGRQCWDKFFAGAVVKKMEEKGRERGEGLEGKGVSDPRREGGRD